MNLGKETEELEFKKSTSELKEGIVSLASMLNKHRNGTLYFGVKNDGEVIGQQFGSDSLREISQAIANFIKPQIIPSISYELIEDKNIIKVSVSGDERPYSAYGRYYMRSANEDRELSPSMLRTIMTNGTETLVNTESNNQELTFTQLKLLYANAGLTLNEDSFRQNLNLLTQSGKYNLMANILADSNSFSIKVAKFRGTDKTELITRNEYGYKCLLLAVKQVLDYAEALNETSVKMTSGQRIETKLFDMDCFREAWLNACLHNSWIKKTPPAVYFFEDRIEIISVGGLPADYSLDDFYAGRSRPVNLELQQIMVQLDFIEQTGHGVPLIVSRLGKKVFDITENFITVTIPLNKSVKPAGIYTNAQPMILSGTQKKILDLISGNPEINIRELAEACKISPTAVNNAIKVMKEYGLVQRAGARKNGYWLLSDAGAAVANYERPFRQIYEAKEINEGIEDLKKCKLVDGKTVMEDMKKKYGF